jgi:hypothetical protein
MLKKDFNKSRKRGCLEVEEEKDIFMLVSSEKLDMEMRSWKILMNILKH